MKRLTVIIPFLNEGIEIYNTVRSIRETAGENVDIVLINDNSQDRYNYEAVAKEFGTFYHKNETRLGVARSRDLGVSMTDTPYLLIVDGHMRFYNNNWWDEIAKHLTKNDKGIYCCKCLPLEPDGSIPEKWGDSYGAMLNVDGKGYSELLEPIWLYKDPDPQSKVIEIPLILGATYATSTIYWKRIKGLKGLRFYGSDEAYLSIKAWMEGSGCHLIKNIEIGHIFRNKQPYEVRNADTVYNKLLIAELLFPFEYKEYVFSEMKRTVNVDFCEAMQLLLNNEELVDELKEYYSLIFSNGYEKFLQINTHAKTAEASVEDYA